MNIIFKFSGNVMNSRNSYNYFFNSNTQVFILNAANITFYSVSGW